MPCQCANLDERWLCRDCGHCWVATLTMAGCPNCGANTDRIDIRNDLAVDHQGRKQDITEHIGRHLMAEL